jgi:importin subunit beta-1
VARQNERTYIMLVVCEGTLAEQLNLRKLFFECLVKIASLYYDKLASYMQQIFQVCLPLAVRACDRSVGTQKSSRSAQITLEAIRRDQEEVAKQAIEFWSTIADEEIALLEAMEEGEEPEVRSACCCVLRARAIFVAVA